MKPELSILLSAYNAEGYIKEAIDSILAQSYTQWELLIADDFSTDNTKSIIDSYDDDRIRVYHNNHNQGKSTTVNQLFKKVAEEAKYVTIHDADDVSLKDRFELLITELERKSELGFIGSNFITIDATGAILDRSVLNENPHDILVHISQRSQFHGPTIVFRKKYLAEQSEIYRDYFQNNHEDSDLILRVLNHTQGANSSLELYKYRILPDSLSKRKITPRIRVLYQLAYSLYEQRKSGVLDYIESKDWGKLDELLVDLKLPYSQNPSLIYHEACAKYNYSGLYKKSISYSWMAVKTEPLKVSNWKLLAYNLKLFVKKNHI